MLIVPTQANANQVITVNLTNFDCILNVYQRAYGLFMDVSISGNLIVHGVICENLTRIVRSAYLTAAYPGFGDFAFVDSYLKGSDPDFTGLGSRYFLAYLETADLSAAGVI